MSKSKKENMQVSESEQGPFWNFESSVTSPRGVGSPKKWLSAGLVLALAASLGVLASSASAQTTSGPVAQIWASKQASGNVEFGLSVTSAGVRSDVPLANRFFLYGDPSTRVGTWYYSEWKVIGADPYRTYARVQVRRLVSGNLEFGLQVGGLGVERGRNRSWLPSGRYFLYQTTSANAKLYSSNLSIRSQAYVCLNGTVFSSPGINKIGLASDCEALLAARDIFQGTSNVFSNWNASTPIASWRGISLNATSDRVTELNYGRFVKSPSGSELNGRIPPHLGVLSELTKLLLDRNSLTGSIPVELGNLTKLTELVLDRNSLTGSIPVELGNLTKLTALHLNDNSLTGSIPVELGNLTNLTWLELANNSLTGSIPAQLGNLTKLTHLYLDTNELTGSIPPQLGNIQGNRSPDDHGLTEVDLSDNNLTGGIPAELGNLTELQTLDLRNNNLTGSIPPSIGHIITLIDFHVNSNNLSGTIPAQLGNLRSLDALTLYTIQGVTDTPSPSDNPGLSGCIPDALNRRVTQVFRGNLPWCSSAVAQVWASKQASGNVEFGLSVTSAGVRRDIPLANRFFLYGDPSTEVGTWYYSEWKVIEADSYRTDARVQVRRLVSGNLEFGLQVRDLGVEQGDNRSCLPSGRYFLYQATRANSKLYSSNLIIRPQMCS